MHELALSENIVRTALDASGEKRDRITAIGVEVGALSAVNVSSLEFCLRMMLDERGLEGAEVRITPVPALAQCECGSRYEARDMFSPCPECGGFLREVIAGKDVIIQYVEVENGED